MSFGNYPLVSVVMITYGHEKYISQAIDGVLAQKYRGEIELIVANDHSPDNTEEIVLEIIRNNQNGSWIKYTNHEENMGMMKNFIWALSQSNGKYIALCEGDDYWIDPLKLQKQIGFLEKNKDCGLVYSDLDFLDNINRRYYKDIFKSGNKKIYTSFEDILINTPYIAPCSWMFRKEVILDYINSPNELFNSTDGSFVMALLFALKSRIRYISETTCVYRITRGSANRPLSISKRYLYIKGIFDTQMKFTEFYSGKLPLKEIICKNFIEKRFLLVYYSKDSDIIRLIEKDKSLSYKVKLFSKLGSKTRYQISKIIIDILQIMKRSICIKNQIIQNLYNYMKRQNRENPL